MIKTQHSQAKLFLVLPSSSSTEHNGIMIIQHQPQQQKLHFNCQRAALLEMHILDLQVLLKVKIHLLPYKIHFKKQ